MGSTSYDSVIEEVKRRLNIIDLIQNYVSLKKSGKGYVGLCPFHDDSNPSMHVSEDKGLFHCFSCGAGGDIFGFMMRYNNLNFRDSLTELARLADVELKTADGPPAKTSRKNALVKLNSLVCNFYHKNLFKSPKAESARLYLKKRGINSETARLFRLGYALNGWNTLCDYLSGKNVPFKYPEEVGLIARKKDGGHYDRFRNRIIFPIFDITGNVTGFGGRVLNNEDSPKYYNSPESILYKKRNSFYGLNVTLQNIRKSNTAILVEGYFDLISLYAHGVDNVVSTLGTSFTTDHAKILKRYTDNVIILFDGDRSGIQSAEKAGEVMIESGIMPRIALLPEESDPDSFIRQKGKEEFTNVTSKSVLLPEFIIDRTFSEFKKGNLSRQKSAEKLADFISGIGSSIDRSHYVSRVAGIFGFRENDLYSMLKTSSVKIKDNPSNESERNPNELLLLKIVLKFPDLASSVLEDDILQLIRDSEIKLVLEKVAGGDYRDVSQLIGMFDNNSVQDLVSEAIFSSDAVTERSTAHKMLNHCIARLRLRSINDQLLMLRKKIEESSKLDDSDSEKQLVKDYKDLVEKEKKVRGELNES